MSNTTFKNALITCNISLTDSDGKSLRLLNLANVIQNIGFKVTFIVNNCKSNEARRFSVIENNSPLRDTLLDSLIKKIIHYFKQSIKLISFYLKLLIVGTYCDLIVSSLAGSDVDSLLACILSKIKRVPFIYDYDDPSPELRIVFFSCSTYDLRVRLTIFTRNFLIKNSSLVITAADTVRHQIIKDFKTRVYVWYNIPKFENVNLLEDKKSLRRKLGLDPNVFIVSYLGRVPSWGISHLKKMIVGFAEKFQPNENVSLLIIGGGKWEEYYRNIAEKLGLTRRVLITGIQTREKALEYLMASDVSCIPFVSNVASNNIVPTKLFEAMALGIPVICIKSKNYVKILGENGIYFDGTCEDLFKKIRWSIVNKKELAKISSNLRLQFQLKYSWNKQSTSLKKIIESLI